MHRDSTWENSVDVNKEPQACPTCIQCDPITDPSATSPRCLFMFTLVCISVSLVFTCAHPLCKCPRHHFWMGWRGCAKGQEEDAGGVDAERRARRMRSESQRGDAGNNGV
eukprot:3454102-Pyramimonas_sp.AAC.1